MYESTHFLCILSLKEYVVKCLDLANRSEKWYLNIGLICTSFITIETEHVSLCLWALPAAFLRTVFIFFCSYFVGLLANFSICKVLYFFFFWNTCKSMAEVLYSLGILTLCNKFQIFFFPQVFTVKTLLILVQELDSDFFFNF